LQVACHVAVTSYVFSCSARYHDGNGVAATGFKASSKCGKQNGSASSYLEQVSVGASIVFEPSCLDAVSSIAVSRGNLRGLTHARDVRVPAFVLDAAHARRDACSPPRVALWFDRETPSRGRPACPDPHVEAPLSHSCLGRTRDAGKQPSG